jgi:branched-chain amino acid transport system substrate-binding protein
MKEYLAWMKKWYPAGAAIDNNNVYGYGLSQTMVQVLKQCGNDFSRDNIMKQATHLDMAGSMLLPGIKITTSPADYHPIKQMQLQRFDGQRWVLFGQVLSGAAGM